MGLFGSDLIFFQRRKCHFNHLQRETVSQLLPSTVTLICFSYRFKEEMWNRLICPQDCRSSWANHGNRKGQPVRWVMGRRCLPSSSELSNSLNLWTLELTFLISNAFLYYYFLLKRVLLQINTVLLFGYFHCNIQKHLQTLFHLSIIKHILESWLAEHKMATLKEIFDSHACSVLEPFNCLL